jgi:hypothetical protein
LASALGINPGVAESLLQDRPMTCRSYPPERARRITEDCAELKKKIGRSGVAIRAAKFETSDGAKIPAFVLRRNSTAAAISNINRFGVGSDGPYPQHHH